jgi:hypothetical protein
MKPDANEKHKLVLDSMLLGLPGVKPGKMFGYPAYYVNRKMFACVYGDGVGVKVPQDLAEALLREEHIVPFQPMGRPRMREWVQINRAESENYMLDMDIFKASADYVRILTKR